MPEPIDLLAMTRDSVFHFVGIGGAGMSAIATVLLEMGFTVEGSDLKESSYVRRLRDVGAVVGIGHRAENVGDSRILVRSSAVRGDNPEVREALRLGIPVVSRAEMLAAIMATGRGIAVGGTHGKTTTSSLIACMLNGCGVDPTYLVGGELCGTGGNAHFGTGDFVVAEADESDGSLLRLRPEVAVITNIDWDHLDYFDSPEHTERIFRDFLELLPVAGGAAVVCGDDERARVVGEDYLRTGGTVVFYGRGESNAYRIASVETGARGGTFEVAGPGGETSRVDVLLPGMHNVYNSLAALAVGRELGFGMAELIPGISSCKGVRRRFDTVGSRGGITVVDDYAHHPAEVVAVLEVARAAGAERVVAVFQPHRYTRTRMLAGDFAASFQRADLVVVTDVYGAGEEPEPGVTGRLIADRILEADASKPVEYFASRTSLAGNVVPLLKPGDLVLTLGAGDITRCAREILELLPPDRG